MGWGGGGAGGGGVGWAAGGGAARTACLASRPTRTARLGAADAARVGGLGPHLVQGAEKIGRAPADRLRLVPLPQLAKRLEAGLQPALAVGRHRSAHVAH